MIFTWIADTMYEIVDDDWFQKIFKYSSYLDYGVGQVMAIACPNCLYVAVMCNLALVFQ